MEEVKTQATKATGESGKKLSRRELLKKAGQTAVAASFLTSAPWVWAQNKVTLRVLGTGTTLLEEIRQKAEEDLGINIVFEVRDGVAALQKAITQPQAYDVYDQWFNSVDLLWPSGSAQPIDLNRIREWDKINSLPKEGRLTPNAKIGQGDAPVRKLYVQGDGQPGPNPTDRITMLPVTHNVDSLGYNSAVVPTVDSWAELLNPEWRGRVALLNDPAIGLMDLGLAVQAAGIAQFGDLGNMTRQEIDTLIGVLLAKKREGQFRAFWNSFTESVNLMASGEVVIESMWSPAVTALRSQGVPVVYASPKEGYRGWFGGMTLSSRTRGAVLDAAYEYLNWWLEGWAGAFVARQGYYFSIPENARKYLTQEEWDYWYDGKPAAHDLFDPYGNVVVRAGEVRDGGSYWERFSNVAVWNSVMDEHNYLVQRWNEFLLA